MEIKKLYGDVTAYSTQKLQETQRVQQDQTTQASAQQTGDKVALSSEARLLASTMSVANTSPDVRADKVRELKEQVQSGTYKPDIRKVLSIQGKQIKLGLEVPEDMTVYREEVYLKIKEQNSLALQASEQDLLAAASLWQEEQKNS